MPDTEAADRWMKPAEVAQRLRIAVSTLSTWRHEGRGPKYAKQGGLVRYRESAVAKFEKDMEIAGDAAREEARSYQHRGAA